MNLERLLAALAAVGGAAVFLLCQQNRLEDEAPLAAVAGAIAGREVAVECPGALARLAETSPEDGFVTFSPDGRPGDEARLSGDTCARLRDLVDGNVAGLPCLTASAACPTDAEQTAVAVNVLSHEAWHLAGVREEAVAQCYALQTNAETARRLGATREDAEAIARFVYRHVQPALPRDYRTYECRDGGALDLRPERIGWP